MSHVAKLAGSVRRTKSSTEIDDGKFTAGAFKSEVVEYSVR